MQPSKLMLIEDSPAFRKVIERTFKAEHDLELVSQFASAEGALRSLGSLASRILPKIILLDLNLPGMSGIEAIPWLQKAAPNARIIILTQSGRESDVLNAIRAGASGYMLKTSTLLLLKEAIHCVLKGDAMIDSSVAQFIINSLHKKTEITLSDIELTPRQLEILTLTSKGFVKKEIADKLNIAHSTVATHIEHVYLKLNVKNAPAAIHQAHRHGIFKK